VFIGRPTSRSLTVQGCPFDLMDFTFIMEGSRPLLQKNRLDWVTKILKELQAFKNLLSQMNLLLPSLLF